ncbi:MAG: glycoside hydrolase family 95 protein, partial [Bacteroidota bacterium]|nr:glycoside hydrolase family 95 protein [Bacteroidota bacterium]
MKQILCILFPFAFLLADGQQNDLELWYKKPAAVWNEALPVGNGRLGGMVFGDTHRENIQLNEESLWAGSKINNNNPQALAHLKEIQEAIFKGEYQKGLDLSNKYLVGTPPNVRSYQTLGNLYIGYHWNTNADPAQYKRSLNLHTGIVTTQFRVDGNLVKEEVFASAPQNCIVVTITANKSWGADFVLSRIFSVENENKIRRRKGVYPDTVAENHYRHGMGTAYYAGQIIDAESPKQGPAGKHMRYAAMMKLIQTDGKITQIETDSSSGYRVTDAHKMVLLITGATDYNMDKLDRDPAIDPVAVCSEIMGKAASLTGLQLRTIQERDHRKIFDRVSFSLGEDSLQNLSTAERLERIKEGKTDNQLAVLYYQMG